MATTSARDRTGERGEVHPYILFAGIVVVLATAFLGLTEMVSVDAARHLLGRSVMASLRGAGRMQDFTNGGALIEPLARSQFELLLSDNLDIQPIGYSGNALLLQPRGLHPYIQGTVTAEFWVLQDGPEPTLISRVRTPLRLPFTGPAFRRALGEDPALCLSLAVVPHDLYGGDAVAPQAIPAALSCEGT